VECPGCGKENHEEFQFCGFCGAALDDAPAAPVLEERKVVSVLFCDLVGFTAASEAADPEDVRADPAVPRTSSVGDRGLRRDGGEVRRGRSSRRPVHV